MDTGRLAENQSPEIALGESIQRAHLPGHLISRLNNESVLLASFTLKGGQRGRSSGALRGRRGGICSANCHTTFFLRAHIVRGAIQPCLFADLTIVARRLSCRCSLCSEEEKRKIAVISGHHDGR